MGSDSREKLIERLRGVLPGEFEADVAWELKRRQGAID